MRRPVLVLLAAGVAAGIGMPAAVADPVGPTAPAPVAVSLPAAALWSVPAGSIVLPDGFPTIARVSVRTVDGWTPPKIARVTCAAHACILDGVSPDVTRLRAYSVKDRGYAVYVIATIEPGAPRVAVSLEDVNGPAVLPAAAASAPVVLADTDPTG
jgi:hypothetical protein